MTHSNGQFSDFAFINCMICRLWYVHNDLICVVKTANPINWQQMNNTSFCRKKCGLWCWKNIVLWTDFRSCHSIWLKVEKIDVWDDISSVSWNFPFVNFMMCHDIVFMISFFVCQLLKAPAQWIISLKRHREPWTIPVSFCSLKCTVSESLAKVLSLTQ